MIRARIFSFLITVFFLTQSAIAQPTITLEGFGGWLWTGAAGSNGSIKVDDNGNYGVRAGVGFDQKVVEFEWNQTVTTMEWYDFINDETFREDATINYYMLGINQEFMEGTAVPFGVLNLGIMNVKFTDVNFSDNWFTVGLGGGVKIYPTDRFGLRLQARIFLPMQFAGVGFGCGTGGCGSGVSGYATTIQGDFTAGVILRLGG